MERGIALTWDGPVARITIDRPERRNAITRAMWDDFGHALDLAETCGCRVLVVTGAGTRAFASGADILEFVETKASPERAKDSFLAVDGICRRLQALPVPVIAAINGYAVGAGLEVAVACDLRIASATARLGITAAKLGITIGRGHMARLAAVVGPARALELLLTARLVDAPEALAMGLVHEVVSSYDLLQQRVHDLTEELLARAPNSLLWAKRGMQLVTRNPDLSGVYDDAEESIACFAQEEFREALAAFRDKRPPRFGALFKGQLQAARDNEGRSE